MKRLPKCLSVPQNLQLSLSQAMISSSITDKSKVLWSWSTAQSPDVMEKPIRLTTLATPGLQMVNLRFAMIWVKSSYLSQVVIAKGQLEILVRSLSLSMQFSHTQEQVATIMKPCKALARRVVKRVVLSSQVKMVRLESFRNLIKIQNVLM